jgi:hypothetical protein
VCGEGATHALVVESSRGYTLPPIVC